MPSAISLWFYSLQPYPERGRHPVSAEDLPGRTFDEFLKSFVAEQSVATQDSERQRIWYFDTPKLSKVNEIDGFIKYGVYGFESNLIDSKTRKHRFKREVGDFEQIDLYYQFWRSSGAAGALLAMQSFQGRSCISLVTKAAAEAFRKEYPGFTLRIRKLMPASLRATVLSGSPVRSVTLVAKEVSSDRSKNYGSATMPEEIDVTVRLVARKNGSFGSLGDLNEAKLGKLRLPVWLVDSTSFDRVSAEIDWNGRRRKVGVFGYSSEAGGMDVTADVTFAANGHPTYESVRSQADDLLGPFAQSLGYVAR